MELRELLTSKSVKPGELARVIGCHKSYVSHVLGGRKKLTRRAAVAIFAEYKAKIGPIAELSDAECRVLVKLDAQAA